MKKYKYIILSVLSFFCVASTFAQRQVVSPFTRFGYGELFEPSMVFAQMGGIGNGLRSTNHINFMNAAHHSAIGKETFLFELGAGYSVRQIRKGSLSSTSHKVGIEYFAMAFPIIPQRWGMAFGLLPFSSVNYSMVEYDNSIGARYDYSGDGGINQLKWGNAVTLFKNFSLGVNASYVFGNLTYKSMVQFAELEAQYRAEFDEYVRTLPPDKRPRWYKEELYRTLRTTLYNTTGFYFDFGAQYVWKFRENESLIFGATYQHKSSLKYDETVSLKSFRRNHDLENKPDYEDIPIDTINEKIREGLSTDLPQRISFGVGYESQKIRAGIDFGWQQWKNVSVFENDYSHLENKKFLKIGVERVANNNFTNYFKRLPYRAGFHIAEMPVFYTINGADYKPIDFGVTFGTEFFLRQTTNSFNVSFDIGRRGEIPFTNNLSEKYIIMKVKVNLKERWFFRKKID
ncbi:MAG: hypothetical protein FWC39_08600 [Bacteroidetes bacterium]|nr:hypothetical protein [Bacteroidota bacterium]